MRRLGHGHKTKHCHRGGQQILAFVLVAHISTRHIKRRKCAASQVTHPRDPLFSGFALHEVNDGSKLPDGNFQNLQPLFLNWKQKVTSQHPFLQPWSVQLVPAPSVSTLTSSMMQLDAWARALKRQPRAHPQLNNENIVMVRTTPQHNTTTTHHTTQWVVRGARDAERWGEQKRRHGGW